MAGYNGLYDLSSMISQPSVMGNGYQQPAFGLPQKKPFGAGLSGIDMSQVQPEAQIQNYGLPEFKPSYGLAGDYLGKTSNINDGFSLGGLWDSAKSGISGISGDVSNWWKGLDGAGKFGAITSGLDAGAGLWKAYTQQKYADKAAKLEAQRQGFYEQQINRQNAKQDLMQSNYNKAMGV